MGLTTSMPIAGACRAGGRGGCLQPTTLGRTAVHRGRRAGELVSHTASLAPGHRPAPSLSTAHHGRARQGRAGQGRQGKGQASWRRPSTRRIDRMARRACCQLSQHTGLGRASPQRPAHTQNAHTHSCPTQMPTGSTDAEQRHTMCLLMDVLQTRWMCPWRAAARCRLPAARGGWAKYPRPAWGLRDRPCVHHIRWTLHGAKDGWTTGRAGGGGDDWRSL